ncbi:beta strand repeat-containing protein [Aeoliella sp.]|uniref:beta strand repeat-containing protein n=1 Tax=Aeoliella sp. TaxID=2795800 RepID=UPI003CCBB398
MNSRAWTWALLSVAVCYASNVAADSLEWTNPIDGDFDDATKWTVTSGAGAPPPAAGDSIFLNEAGAYTIKLTSDEAADFLRATSGTASLVGDTITTHTLDLTTDTADLSVRGAGTLNLGGIGTPLIVNVGDRFEVGHGSGGGDGTVNLSGAGSELNVLGVATHNIGISGNLGRVNVTDDAALSFVDGSTLVLGRSSSGASSGLMDVVDGGDLTAGDIAISTIDSNAFGSLTVRGAGSTAAQTGDSTLSIGNATAATTLLQVIDNAFFTSGTGDITLGQSAVLNVGTVDQNTLNSFAAGGTFNANGPITTSPGSRIVVVDGVLNVNAGLDNSAGGQISLLTGGLLNIANGLFVANDATLDAPEFIVGGEGAGGATELQVSGFGSADVNTLLTIGSTREGTVTVTSGGVLNNTRGGLGFSARTAVGESETGALRILGGGVVNSDEDATIGGSVETGMGSVLVNGPGSIWNVAERLEIGSRPFGSGGLLIENGGVVNSGTAEGVGAANLVALIGGGLVSTGLVIVEGNGSIWNHGGSIRVDGAATGQGSLEINAGGQVVADSLFASSGQVDDVRVFGTGALLSVETLTVGNGLAGGMVVTGGGVVTATTSEIATSTSGGAADVTVFGAIWNAGELSVADTDSASVRVEFGEINSTDTTIAEQAGGNGAIDVEEEGTFDVTGNLVVGGDGMALLRLTSLNGFGPTALATISGVVSIGDQGTIELNRGRLEFGLMSIEDFGQIIGTSGELAGDLEPISGFTDAATLPASLSSETLNFSEVNLVNQGILFGTASVDVALRNDVSSEVETSVGDRLRFGGVGNINAGEINNFGGQIRFDGDATNQATGFVGGRGQFIADGGWTNAGVMAFTAGPADLLGDFTNTAGGVVVTSGNAVTTFFDDLEHNGAEIRTAEGSATVVLGEASGAGAYTGTGTVFFEGDLRPGNSPAVVSFEGDVSIGQTADTLLELAGTELGEFDRLEIAGDLSLDGDLTVELIEGFAPQLGASFEVISTGGQITGEFASETLIDLGEFLSLDVVYFSDAVLLTVVSNLPGDYNSDGTVNIADYTVWRNNLGSSVTLPGDTTPGEVSTVDYDVWRTNFGASLASSASVLTASVPEPSAVFLLMLSLMSIGLRMNRITPAARPTVVS